jgi:hypothetical protein
MDGSLFSIDEEKDICAEIRAWSAYALEEEVPVF